MREGSVSEGIARQLVGREFLSGTFTHYENRAGRFMMVAKCSQCGGPHRGISIANAAQAVQNPTAHLINCQHCTFVVATAAKETYEDVVRIPEARRSSAQQRIVVEHENAQRRAVRQAPINAAQAATSRAIKGSLWDQRERYLMTLAHSVGTHLVNDPRVLKHESFISWEAWQNLSSEVREQISLQVEAYFQANGLQW